ncbi:MAG: T9SS type A sorting domain-containing protein, partial [Bacteroidetes bacterium]|nr:T9SS type A sorting domain-containing protein [Bacteroidota bacterium]
INPLSNDQTPGEYNTLGDNNRITRRQRFTPWLAYDDGSAEGGFGLDYSFLGNVRGQVAMRYKLDKADTLRGISMYFNRSREDVSSRPFTLMIWKRIAEPPALSNVGDQLWYSKYVERPRYTDSIQEFTYYMFDTALVLPAGDFYIGWRQQAPFILNVGYDNNYRFARKGGANPNLFYDLYGKWERVPADVEGAPMMRPLLGSKSQYAFGINNPAQVSASIYPNPGSDQQRYINSQEVFEWYMLYDMQGRFVAKGSVRNASLLLPEGLKPGLYLLQLQTKAGRTVNLRIQNQ